MHGQKRDLEFEGVELEKLHRLLSELKRSDIDWVIDGLTSENGAYGDVGSNRFVLRHEAKLDALITPQGFDHWRKVVDGIWGSINPYTGITTLADPSLLGVIAINEGNIAFLASNRGGMYSATLGVPFAEWLFNRYGSSESLQRAWGNEIEVGELRGLGRGGAVAVPDQVRGLGLRDRDFARFISEVEQAAFYRMQDHLNSRGFRGPVTSFNNWNFLGADASRQALPWIDMHAYHDAPSAHGEPGSHIRQLSLFDTLFQAPASLAASRHWGKPFTVSEYGQPFWNQYRYEMAALMPAMAAHQGWNMICQFAEWPIQFDYAQSPFRRRNAIYPFGVGTDPIARAGERLAAVLYGRGDVRASPNRLRLHVDSSRVFDDRAGWTQVPRSLALLSLSVPVGLDFGPIPQESAPNEVSLPVQDHDSPALTRLRNLMEKSGLNWDTRGQVALQSAGILDKKNRTDLRQGRFESDTGELFVDVPARQILIDTPRTAVVVVRGGSASTSRFGVSEASGPALFAISSLDGAPLKDSRRMLVWVLTDAMNTGMRFEDPERKTLTSIGRLPPVIRTTSANLLFETQAAGKVRAWPLSMDGERRAPLTVQRRGDQVTLRLDTAKLPDGPALYFEVVVDAQQ